MMKTLSKSLMAVLVAGILAVGSSNNATTGREGREGEGVYSNGEVRRR